MKVCETCLHIQYAIDKKGELVHSCRISGDIIDPGEDLEYFGCDDYDLDRSKIISEKPSKEEILEAIRQGVFDALNLSLAEIKEAIVLGVSDAFTTLSADDVLEAIREGTKLAQEAKYIERSQ